jgi:hypothetical protein
MSGVQAAGIDTAPGGGENTAARGHSGPGGPALLLTTQAS